MKYESFGQGNFTAKNIVAGLHLSDAKARKIGLPVLGTLAGLTIIMILRTIASIM